jgi:hypothetical protein
MEPPRAEETDPGLCRHCARPCKASVARKPPQGWTFGKRHKTNLESNNGIRERGQKKQVCLGSNETLYMAAGKRFEKMDAARIQK